MSATPAVATSGVLHAVEHLSSSVVDFLAQATRELLQGGVRQTVVYASHGRPAPPRDLPARFDPRVRLVPIERPSGRWHWAFARALCDELSARPYDAVHLHAGKAGFVGRLALGSLPSHPPVYYTPHGLTGVHSRRALASLLGGWLERLAVYHACHPVGCGHGEARALERLTRRSASVLEDAVDAAYFELALTPDSRPRVLTIGGRGDIVGARRLAELAARFHFAGEPVHFVWAGHGESRLEQPLAAAGVEIVGPLDDCALRTQLARAHVYLHTSRRDARGTGVSRAMAAGLPCVVAGVPGSHDLVSHQLTGLLGADVSALAEQVKRLLDHPARARELGDSARREARQRFHPQRFRHALLALYRLDVDRLPAPDSARAGAFDLPAS